MSNLPKEITKIDNYTWEIPQSYKKGMQVPARIIASQQLLNQMDKGVFDQVTNVACLPGIQKHALCMPDGHWGYGFPIGGVAAFNTQDGVISPGGVGFDINCGIRLLTTNLTWEQVQPKIKQFTNTLFEAIPSGVGCKGFVKLTKDQFKDVMIDGVKWCRENNYGEKEDEEFCESKGKIEWADPNTISERAIARGINQLGTLGAGNHFLEIQVIKEENIKEKEIAKVYGLFPNQVVIMVHCGSRGFGHQVATDFLKTFKNAMPKYKIQVPDPELSCAPFASEEGQKYYKAMACAANMAFANRQVITHRIREACTKIFKEDTKLDLVYDVAHNIAKREFYKIDGKRKELIVHRKGATRAFGPNNEELPKKYQKVGQPIILGGSMETGSYILAGTQKAMEETFGSTAHGSGRTMSRNQAKKELRGEDIRKQMLEHDIYVKTDSLAGLAEEAGCAYKDINTVVETLAGSGISKPIAQLRPKANIKG